MTTLIEVQKARVAYKDAAIAEVETLCNGIEARDPEKVRLLEQHYEQVRARAQETWLDYVEVVRQYHDTELDRVESVAQVGETEWKVEG